MYRNGLSSRDLQVLALVFDPESNPCTPKIQIDHTAPSNPSIPEAVFSRLREQEQAVIDLVEQFELGQHGEKSNTYRQALQALNDLIDVYPNFASARNNRAQLRRWYQGDAHILQILSTSSCSFTHSSFSSIDDLEICISLAEPSGPERVISPFQCRLLGQAHTQLATLYHATSKCLGPRRIEHPIGLKYWGWTKEQFAEAASQHFYLGGMYGNAIAKALAVHCNPHAKLCGSIVQEALRRELFLGSPKA